MKTALKKISLIILEISFLAIIFTPKIVLPQSLNITKHKPIIDGKIMDSEYSLSIDIKDGKIYLSRTKNRLYAAIRAKTTEWVAMGFNSSKMNNADIIIGYVNGNKKVIKSQKGVNRVHKDYTIPYLLKSEIAEKGKYTTLEVELKIGDSTDSLKLGMGNLNMIAANGKNDNIKSYHKFRTSVTVKLE